MKQKLSKYLIAISVLLAATKCTKFVFDRGSAPDPAGGAHDAPPDPQVCWGGDTPSPFPPLGSHAFGVRFQRSATSLFTV